MAYDYLEDSAVSDAGFEASGRTAVELFEQCWEATLKLMIANPSAIREQTENRLECSSDSLEMLLFDMLGELLYYKDADATLLRLVALDIREEWSGYRLTATARGEKINAQRHALGVDIKAVTLHQFKVEQTADGGFSARVVLDT